ncbi:hypothetical protein D1AOALGA4SA_9933 [Olavius algarvensis Delta 1 endosymbiont]|nr:hypothetical protein D1AOALGA4SA_9933 [Olavius algarvensis Delta 1 endosymbiont]
MLPNIQKQYDDLKLKLEALLQRLDSLTTERLYYKAGPDKWSIVEAVEHLVIAETGLIEELSKNIPISTLDPAAKTPDKHRIVIKVMERDIEVDVPHESLEPHGRTALEDLLAQWDDIRAMLPGLLAQIAPDKIEDPVFQHPFGGPLDIADTLQFFEVHFDNHMRHIDRILAQPEK